ncbi:MAG: hypothetical protein R2745_15015 [Vicinamibacterales bacterium]
MGILPDGWPSDSWNGWAHAKIVQPIAAAMGHVTGPVFGPFTSHLGNLRFPQLARLVNHPRATLRATLLGALSVDRLRFHRLLKGIRDSQVSGLVAMLDDYLTRLDSIEHAMSALAGRRLPIIEGLSQDLHTLLGPASQQKAFPASVVAMLEQAGDAFEGLLGALEVIAGSGHPPAPPFDLPPGHFYDWVCCTTSVDAGLTPQQKKEQQRLRQTMVKVLLAYIDGADIGPSWFKAGATPGHDAGGPGFTWPSVSSTTVTRRADGALRAYAGLLAAAFEHVFVSSRPLASVGAGTAADLYFDLPMSLKMQRPDLAALAFATPGVSAFQALEHDSEYLAMRVATTTASVSAGGVRTAINAIGNGIWEISPNNPPLVDTVASAVAMTVYELEKALVYDLLRRFRVYLTDQPIDTSSQFLIATTTLVVPDFAGADRTEKTLTAAVGVACGDTALLAAARQVFGTLPIALDVSPGASPPAGIDGLLRGLMRDALAAATVLAS